MDRRRAFTLLELLVVVAVLGILIALLLCGVQRVRVASLQLTCLNQMKQIALACSNYASNRQGKLPGLHNKHHQSNIVSLFTVLLPYHDGRERQQTMSFPGVSCPLDPTIGVATRINRCTYAANAQVFARPLSLRRDFPDGTTQTILFAEHFGDGCHRSYFTWAGLFNESDPFDAKWSSHRASFADEGKRTYPLRVNGVGSGDVFPLTEGQPPVSTGSVPGLTFQLRPTEGTCDPRIPQTGHLSGMPIAMADGSVLIITDSIAHSTFWGLVTNDGGERLVQNW